MKSNENGWKGLYCYEMKPPWTIMDTKKGWYCVCIWCICLHVCRVNSTNYCSFVRTPFQDRALARPRTLMCKFIVLKWLGLSQVWSIAFTFGGIWGNKNLGLNSKRASCTCLPALVACGIFAWFFCLPIWLKQCSRELFIDALLVTGPWRRRSESNLGAIAAIVQLFIAVLAQVLGIKRHRVRCRSSPDFGNPNFWTNMFFPLLSPMRHHGPWAMKWYEYNKK